MTTAAPFNRRSPLGAGAFILLVLLVVLATLQYRWVGELSDASLQRLRASAHARALDFAREFDREVTRAFLCFMPAPGVGRDETWAAVGTASRRWRTRVPEPRLVKGVFVLALAGTRVETRVVTAEDEVRVQEWPPELLPLRDRLTPVVLGERPAGVEHFRADPIDEDVPALVLPVLDFGSVGAQGWPAGGRRPLRGFVVVALDLAYVRETWLPSLERRFLTHVDGYGYYARITAPARAAAVYVSPGVVGAPRVADASVHLLEVRLEPQNRDLLDDMDPALQAFWRRRFGIEDALRGDPEETGWDAAGRWRVDLWNRAGGLTGVVAAARRRNLALSFGGLLLLGGSVALLVAAARRAEHLARQQVEFVAGVTHELRTPLAVIRSAGENLADGLVSEAAQVRSYGALVRDEGRRLSEMVEQVLDLAGAGSGRPLASEPVPVSRLVDNALRSCDAELRAAGVDVARDLPEGLPPARGDEASLQRALHNLVDNAVKYAGAERWIGIAARLRPGARAPVLDVTIEDRGPGIDPSDLPHVFEPFYRGRDAVAQGIRGSGIGLSLVHRIAKAHGGDIVVESRPGRTVFTLTLPTVEK